MRAGEPADDLAVALAENAVLRAEIERVKANGRKLAMHFETFIYERHRCTEGMMVAQIQKLLTDQDVDDLNDPPQGGSFDDMRSF